MVIFFLRFIIYDCLFRVLRLLSVNREKWWSLQEYCGIGGDQNSGVDMMQKSLKTAV